MPITLSSLSLRQRMILCGLLFSKYGEQTLQHFGLSSLREGFNLFGLALGGKPGTIRAYRDELDPYVPNPRRGWVLRPLRPHCREILDAFAADSFQTLAGFFTELLDPSSYFQQTSPPTDFADEEPNASNSFARRLATGRSAEQYFLQRYHHWPEFSDARVTDATAWGCGFDFKIDFASRAPFLLVEVKGLQSQSGAVSLTMREHKSAGIYGPRYFLCVVRNFAHTPNHLLINDPLAAISNWHLQQRVQTVRSWTATL